MAGLTAAQVAQLYDGIYGPPAQGPMAIEPMSIEEMYRGIYGPANATPAPAPTPPSAPVPDVYRGIYGPGNLANEPGSFPPFGALLDMFPGSSQTKTQHVTPAAPNGTGYQADYLKADNERLLPTGIGGPPTTRPVQSVPMGGGTLIASIPTPGMPRPRPPNAPAPAATALASLFGPTTAPARQPLRVTVNGANAYAPTPAPASQRPAPRQNTSIVEMYKNQGMSSQQAYDTANRASVENAIANSSNSDAARRLNERLGNI